MLRELHISNLAVIEDVSLELDEGFNCFTGQTGAGKSLILGAFETLLGLRGGGADLLRPGADEARVSGLFELHDPHIAREISTLLDEPLEPGSAGAQLLITRKIFASGRSSHSVNGQPVTAGMVKQLGQALVDIHGQHDHQYLLKPGNQLLILDRFAELFELRQQYTHAHARLRELFGRRAELLGSDTLRRQQLELYEFQAQEIDDAAPLAGEHPELEARFRLLSNLSKVRADAGQAHAALYEADGSVLERLQIIVHVLRDLAEMDEDLHDTAEQIRSATLLLQEGAYDLGRYLDRLELDPAELAEVEQRLNLLNRLASKYGPRPGVPVEDDPNDPLAAVLAYRAQIESEILKLRSEQNDLAGMDRQVELARREVENLGAQLSAQRRSAFDKLAPLVARELKQLGMPDAELAAQWDPAGGDGEDAPGSATGFETLELLVRTNPGQPARPLRKIASGGELSRIMLALKSILADADRVSVLVFDEIDANIGGRLGAVIGQKLRALAQRQRHQAPHQILCITHLPQIAAWANRHLRISKAVEGKGKSRTTRTTVAALEGDQRVAELAEMLAGADVTATTRKQVAEMLAAAR